MTIVQLLHRLEALPLLVECEADQVIAVTMLVHIVIATSEWAEVTTQTSCLGSHQRTECRESLIRGNKA